MKAARSESVKCLKRNLLVSSVVKAALGIGTSSLCACHFAVALPLLEEEGYSEPEPKIHQDMGWLPRLSSLSHHACHQPMYPISPCCGWVLVLMRGWSARERR